MCIFKRVIHIVHFQHLPRYRLKTKRELEVIDGRLIKSGNITHMTKVNLFINGHEERLPAFITHLGHYPLVLGKPWLKRHDVSIRFATDTIIFDSAYCLNNCTERAVQIKGITIDPPEHASAAPPPSAGAPPPPSAGAPPPPSDSAPPPPSTSALPPTSPLPPESPSPPT